MDIIEVLTESIDPGAYWRKLKQRLLQEGNETVTNCHSLKMFAADGKMHVTDTVLFFKYMIKEGRFWKESRCANKLSSFLMS